MLDVRFEYVNSSFTGSVKSTFLDALSKIKLEGSLLKMSIFKRSISKKNYTEQLRFMQEKVNAYLGDCKVEISYVAQKTLQSELVIELVFTKEACTVNYKSYKGLSYVTLGQGSGKTLFLSGVIGDINKSVAHQSKEVFETIEAILQVENMPISSIVRQWNYIPEITAFDHGFQYYQQFNDARALFYNQVDWSKGYPAATGIGTKNAPLLIDVIAMQGHQGEIPLMNTKQINAHIYSDEVLLGTKEQSLEKRGTPKFERAKLIMENSGATVFVSGTAAIIGEKSLALNDAAKQTDIIINHIESLVSKGMLNACKTWLVTEFASARTYIKHVSDFQVVKQVCEKRLPGVPVVFVKADVCRDELLVEIEAFVKIKELN